MIDVRQTPYCEANALLAVLDGDEEEATRWLRVLNASERERLRHAADDLTVLIAAGIDV